MKRTERVENRGDAKGMPLTIKGRRVSKDYLIENGIIEDLGAAPEKRHLKMDRQISLQAAIDVLNKHSILYEFYLPHEFYEVKKEIRDLPSVQSEIVRCVDCVYSDTFPKGADNGMPLKCLGIRYGGVMPDWYCEHAERRTDE